MFEQKYAKSLIKYASAYKLSENVCAENFISLHYFMVDKFSFTARLVFQFGGLI